MILDHASDPLRDGPAALDRRQPVGGSLDNTALHLLLEPGNPDLEELVEVRTDDAEILDPLEQWIATVQRLVEHALIELEPTELPVDVAVGTFGHSVLVRMTATRIRSAWSVRE